MKFQLFLDTHNEELFSKTTSELGTIFFKALGNGKYEIVYFSGSRLARFIGKPRKQLLKLCEACGYPVDVIEIDESFGTLKIIQKGDSDEKEASS